MYVVYPEEAPNDERGSMRAKSGQITDPSTTSARLNIQVFKNELCAALRTILDEALILKGDLYETTNIG
jgi:hypothetical protein